MPVSKTALPSELYRTIHGLGICRTPSTARGCRGGASRRRTIGVRITTQCIYGSLGTGKQNTNIADCEGQSGVNINNLVKVKVGAVKVVTADRCFSVCSLNSRSVKNKTLSLRDYIVSRDFDVVALTETWLGSNIDRHVTGELVPTGYKLKHVPRPGDRKGGGVALLYKSAISLRVTGSTGSEFSSFEYMTCDMGVNKDRSLCFCVIYRPPPSKANRLTTLAFHEEWSTFLSNIVTGPKDIVIVGDINFHLDVPTDRDTQRFMSVLQSCGLQQHVTGATHIHGHTLDVIITRYDSAVVSDIEVTDPGLCDHMGKLSRDHFAVNFTTGIAKPVAIQKAVSFRKLRAIDVEHFKRDIAASHVLHNFHGSPDELLSCYNDIMRTLVDKHAPLRTKTIHLRPNSPWYTEELHEAKHLRRKLERKWRQTKLNVDHQIYRQQCTHVNKLIRQTRISHYSNKISECGRDTKGVYRIARHLMGDKGSGAVFPQNIPHLCLAEQFSDFFSKKIADIRDGLQQDGTDNTLAEDRHVEVPLGRWPPATQKEVRAIIMKSPDKSCELDPAPTWLLKLCIDSLLPLITSIINSSLETGCVPKDFKVARIKPLLKKSGLDPDILKHYRPVSNLPFLSKIMEKVVDARLEQHLVKNSLHEPSQSAYKKFHSTETALLKVQNDILRSLDAGAVTALVMLDLSAAFDTIDHPTLLRRFERHFGIEGTALAWISSYLSNRYQSVSVNGELSKQVLLQYGVPQGSVLGPKKYVMYTKPLGDIIRQHGVDHHFYADDTQVYLSFMPQDNTSREDALSRIELCLVDIQSWMTKNKLKLNSDKTEVMLFTSRHNQRCRENFSVNIDGSVVKAVSQVKNLGVTYDSAMTMERHINNICRSAYAELRNIGRIRRYMTNDATRTLVNGLVTSRLDYCNVLLQGLPNTLLHKMQRVQNTSARVITRTSRHSHITPVLKALHWLPIQSRLDFKVLVQTYKALDEQAPGYVRDMISVYTPARTLRSQKSLNLVTPRFKSAIYGKRCFSLSAASLWNNLPCHIKESSSVDIFKRSLKTHLFLAYYNNF